MPSELEQPHYSDDREEFHDVGILQMWGKLPQQQIYVKTSCSYVVDDINGTVDEFAFVWTGNKSDQDFEGEPSVANTFDVEESYVCISVYFINREIGSILGSS